MRLLFFSACSFFSEKLHGFFKKVCHEIRQKIDVFEKVQSCCIDLLTVQGSFDHSIAISTPFHCLNIRNISEIYTSVTFHVEVYGPYQVMLKVDRISIYTMTYVTTDNDQKRQIYLGQDELKVRRIGLDAMMEQDAVHIGYEADVTAHLLDLDGKKIGVTGLLDIGAVVSVMPIKTWERMGFTREDPIPTNIRLAAANRGAIYVVGRNPVTVLHMGGRNLWMSFLVVKNLVDSDQFILERDFVRNFDVMIDPNNGLIRIRNPDRKSVKRTVNRIRTDENKIPIFLYRKVKD